MRREGFVFMALLSGLLAGCGDDGEGGGGAAARIQTGTVITVDAGSVEGEAVGTTRRFLGIPFAAPPMGDLRWRPPQPVAPWDGVLETRQFSDPCPQTGSLTTDPSENEDCLYLNVWAPDPAPERPLPVMVWFHGGGNTSGSASDPVPFGVGDIFYDGQGLVEQENVVVVTTNYRLGVMGFFAHAALSEESPRGSYGNQGLLDQRAALEWVQRNIAVFGGDPENVTIFGESAGAFDVCFHMVSPGSRGLFHRAISQSGGCTTLQKTRAEAEAEAVVFADAVGCADAGDPLACLRERPVADLLIEAPVDGAAEPGAPGGDFYRGGTARWSFGPIVDGDVVPAQPREMFSAGDIAEVPYVLGSNSDEGSLFHIGATPVTTPEEYELALERTFGELAGEIETLYPLSDFEIPNDAIVRVTGDSLLVCSTYDTAVRAADAGIDVHLYNFSRPVPIPALQQLRLGATHGAEIAYVFGSVGPGIPPEDIELSEFMRGYWGRFAARGNPNGEGFLEWPRFLPEDDRRINFDIEPSVIEDFRSDLCAFWRAAYRDGLGR